jgi:gliding motility-associated-like protein
MTVNLDVTTMFTLTVTDINGCENSDQMIIEVLEPPDSVQALTGPGNHCLGETAIIPIRVFNFIEVASFQLRLSYNVDKLNLENHLNLHPALYDANIWEYPAGVITISWQSDNPVTFPGIETILELVFTTKEPGLGQLEWYTTATDSYFLDINDEPIPAEFYAGDVNIYAPPELFLPGSLSVCEEQPVTLSGIAQGTHPPFTYLWIYPNGQTSAIDPSFDSVSMSDAGDYTLLVTDSLGCTDQKTISLKVYENPVAQFHGIDTLQVPIGYVLEAGPGMASYYWNTGETTENITIYAEGWRIVEMISQAGCYGIDSVYILLSSICLDVPNAFTPNGDGLNDYFEAVTICPIKNFRMLIYNRWGEKLFESNDISHGWDGRKNGKECPGDMYVFVVTYEVEESPGEDVKSVLKGTVLLLK